MSFKRGNIVRQIDTYWHGHFNEPKDDIGKLYVIEYSFGEKYGDGSCYGGYSIIDIEDGYSSSWWDESCLEFVEEGNINLIKQLKEKNDKIREKHKDINWIKENFDENLSLDSILSLFHKVKYESSFERNGEYCILIRDWDNLYPIFNAIFNENKKQMMKLIDETFKEKFKEKYIKNFSAFYEEIFKRENEMEDEE